MNGVYDRPITKIASMIQQVQPKSRKKKELATVIAYANSLGSNSQISYSNNSLQCSNEAVKDTEDEFKRKCNWKRIFPSIEYQYYKQFFTEDRPLNNIVDARVM